MTTLHPSILDCGTEKPRGYNALQAASMSGQLESVQMLLEAIGVFWGQSRWQRNKGPVHAGRFLPLPRTFLASPWNKYLHPKIKRLEPQNGGLEAVFPFLVGDFQVKDVEFRGSSNILKKVLEGLAAFPFLGWRRNSCCHGEPFSSKRINFQPFCGAGKMCPFDECKQLNNKMPPKFCIFGCLPHTLYHILWGNTWFKIGWLINFEWCTHLSHKPFFQIFPQES